MPDTANPTILIALLIAAYLVGSVPFAVVVSKIFGLADPRSYGSGNPGATNVLRSGNKAAAALTLIGDAAKGWLAVWFAARIGASPLVVALVALAVFIGHLYPLFLGFKGGKGVATSAGALVGIAPGAMGLGLLSWAVLLVSTRYMSVASIGAAVVVPAAGWWFYRGQGLALPIALSALGSLIVWRHKGNIQRLMAGTESRFEFKKKESEVRSQKSE